MGGRVFLHPVIPSPPGKPREAGGGTAAALPRASQ